ncbi:MAG: DUF1684 domain-containing protein [Bifidobacteriaceae bacterium]|jgi:uncharacterized protein (DUF1684 family)|nr:DUF1684 domain-containing protein [Bifidobacteriaceae bacterium]
MSLDAPSATTQQFLDEWSVWHQERVDEYSQPYSWLSLTSMTWLKEGEVTRIDSFPGTWLQKGDTVTFTPDAETDVANRGTRITSSLAVTVHESGDISAENIDTADGVRAELIKRLGSDRIFAVRIRDPKSPNRTGFDDIPHFDVDSSWVVPARFIPDSEKRDVEVSADKRSFSVEHRFGTLYVTVDGKEIALTVLQDHNDSTGMSTVNVAGERIYFDNRHGTEHTGVLRFRDATSGKQTYGGGRRLTIDVSNPEAITQVDFNRAHNASCAFTPYCTCPFAPLENNLPFAVEAGECTPRVIDYSLGD